MPSPVDLRIHFPTLSLATPPSVRRARVRDDEGSHLLAEVDVVVPRGRIEEGTPARLTWGFRSAPVTSVMYVHRVDEPSSAAVSESFSHLVLVGASWPLREGRQRVLQGSASQVLRTIAGDHGLASSFSAASRTFDNFVSRESDWSAVRSLARRTGGLLRVEGVGIRIFDMNEGLQRSAGAPIYSDDSTKIGTFTTKAHRQDARQRKAVTLNGSTKTVMEVNDDNPFDSATLLLSDPVARAGDPREVEKEITAERLHERLRETAEISTMVGSPHLRPGEVIGFQSRNENKRGYWTVTSARHELIEEKFTTKLVLGRSADHPRSVLPPRPVRTTPVLPPMSSPTLRGGRWVAR